MYFLYIKIVDSKGLLCDKSVICVMVFESVVKIIGENYLNLIVVSDDFDEYIIYGKIISMWFWYMFLSFLLVLLNFLINCY